MAEIAKEKGFDVWIGRREQRDRLSEAFPHRQGELKQLVSLSDLGGLNDISNVKDAEFIDLLWLRRKDIVAAFEIEVTTSMTEALKRGSSLPPDVPKYIVIPQEREDQLLRKLDSPLFRERFQNDSWKTIFAETLEVEFGKHGRKMDMNSIVDKRAGKKAASRSDNKNQLRLFDEEKE